MPSCAMAPTTAPINMAAALKPCAVPAGGHAGRDRGNRCCRSRGHSHFACVASESIPAKVSRSPCSKYVVRELNKIQTPFTSTWWKAPPVARDNAPFDYEGALRRLYDGV